MTAIPVAKLIHEKDDGAIQAKGQSQAPARSDGKPDTTVNMNVPTWSGLGNVEAKPVGTGVWPADSHADVLSHAVDAAMDSIRNPPGPRDRHQQAPLSAKQAPSAAPIATEDTSGVD